MQYRKVQTEQSLVSRHPYRVIYCMVTIKNNSRANCYLQKVTQEFWLNFFLCVGFCMKNNLHKANFLFSFRSHILFSIFGKQVSHYLFLV